MERAGKILKQILKIRVGSCRHIFIPNAFSPLRSGAVTSGRIDMNGRTSDKKRTGEHRG